MVVVVFIAGHVSMHIRFSLSMSVETSHDPYRPTFDAGGRH